MLAVTQTDDLGAGRLGAARVLREVCDALRNTIVFGTDVKPNLCLRDMTVGVPAERVDIEVDVAGQVADQNNGVFALAV